MPSVSSSTAVSRRAIHSQAPIEAIVYTKPVAAKTNRASRGASGTRITSHDGGGQMRRRLPASRDLTATRHHYHLLSLSRIFAHLLKVLLRLHRLSIRPRKLYTDSPRALGMRPHVSSSFSVRPCLLKVNRGSIKYCRQVVFR